MTELKLLQCRLDGRYDIEECLSRGSYAEIYVARDRGATDERFRRVVIKALNVLLQGDQDPDLERTLIQNFQNEAIALDRVRHPHIISRLGHGTALDLGGRHFHYIVLEYLDGGDLAALSRKQPLGLERALAYLQQVCAGLSYAHECGVIHRDIKPQNLLLTADQETAKIADFGVAKLEAAEGAITRVGTNLYAAPEHNPLVQTSQLDTGSLPGSHTQLTPAADVYSLAKTAYTLICGAPPRRFAHHPLSELPAPISGEFWAPSLLRVLERATQARPGDRYQRVQDFWDELNDAAMAPTQQLGVPQPLRRLSSDLGLESDVLTAAPPPKPRFETSKELQHHNLAGNGAVRPRVVVPIAGAAALTQPPEFGTIQHAGRITVSVPRNEAAGGAKIVAAELGPKPASRLRNFIVATILVVVFAGMLAATFHYTRNYIRARWNTRTAAQQSQQTLLGREAVTTTDLNLRSGPNATNDQVGLAESGSRVKVVDVSGNNNNWLEVQVIEHARQKENPGSADRGWVNKRFLKFD